MTTDDLNTLVSELAGLESEAASIRTALDAAGLDTPALEVVEQRTRLDQLERAIQQRRPAVERAQQEAQQRAADEDRRLSDLRRAEQWLAELLACEDGVVLIMRVGDWRIMVQQIAARIRDLGGQPPADLPARPPLPDRELVQSDTHP